MEGGLPKTLLGRDALERPGDNGGIDEKAQQEDAAGIHNPGEPGPSANFRDGNDSQG